MNGAVIRPAVASDVAAIAALEQGAPEAPHWRSGVYEEIVQNPCGRRCLLVADRAGELLGFAAGMVLDGEPGEIESVVVAAGGRREGVGRALCQAVLEWMRLRGAADAVLEVRASSAGAVALYRSLGFVETNRRAAYYISPLDDALRMRLPLEA